MPAGFAGRIVVLHFWASWCPPCVEEMKALQSLSAELQGLGFQPLSIDVGEEKAVVEVWLRPLGIGYPILLDPDSAVAGPTG